MSHMQYPFIVLYVDLHIELRTGLGNIYYFFGKKQ